MTGNQGGPMRLAKPGLKWSLLAGTRHPISAGPVEQHRRVGQLFVERDLGTILGFSVPADPSA